ncbi:MAG TPA: peptide ligase PGM1-related protein [Jatrophihabitans sp.]|nr:peptide ligase PGM1-related protein [Jatrophihabitans sp.]
MPRLIVGNTRTDGMVGDLTALSPPEREYAGCAALRLLWYARSGDVVVLPMLPRPDFLAYVTSLTGTDPDSLDLLAPPPGELGAGLLTPDRTAEPGFHQRLAAAVRQRSIAEVLVVYQDTAVAQLVQSLGLRLPGHAFSAEGGDGILNSKAGFRAIAAGAGAPIVPGLATTRPDRAIELVTRLLAAGHSAIVKREFCCGSNGNEILSPVAGVRVAGAQRAVLLTDAAAVADYFGRRWDWLTIGGRYQVVIEQYLTDCDTVYSEYLVGDDGPQLLGVAEILMSPMPVGEIAPAQALPAAARTVLIEAGTRIARAFQAIGYRGFVSTDAVLTPSGQIFITEANARMSGSTHLHVVIRDRVLQTAHRDSRLLLEIHGWSVPSFAAAVARLAGTGLAFDRETGIGVMLTTDQMPDGTVTYCVVAEDLRSAKAIEGRLSTLFAFATDESATAVDGYGPFADAVSRPGRLPD